MRYLNSAVVLAVVGASAVYACGGDSASISASHAGTGGEAGSTAEGGTTSGGVAGKGGGSAGKGGGFAGSAGTTAGGSAGAGGTTVGGGAGQGGEAGAVNEGGAGGEQATVGSLTITVGAVPDGKTTSITVTGPGGFSQVISSTTTLQNLEPGTYAVAATPTSIRVSGTQVDSIFDAAVTGSGTVQAGATASIDVSYPPRGGTGMMWVTNYVTRNAFGFSGTQLAATGAQTDAASVALNLPNLGTGSPQANSLAFSSNGDLWIGYCKNTQKPQVLAKFSGAKLAASGSPSADVVVTLPSIDNTYDCASALAFDSSGNLWVGMYHSHILRINAGDLAASGTPTPAITLTQNLYFANLLDIAFDKDGNLFVDSFGGQYVSRLSASQLTTDNPAVVPTVLLKLPAGVGAGGLAIGQGGNLWVSDYSHSSVIKFNASDLNASGTPTPGLTITSVPGPEQLAFDKAGNLWVTAYDSSQVYAFAAADLTTGGAKTPLTTLTGGDGLNSTYGLRFNPGAP